MKQLFFYITVCMIVSCSKIDNYPAPGCTVTDSTIDEVTITLTTIGGALPAQDVYFRVGARINAGLDEYNYNTPVPITYP